MIETLFPYALSLELSGVALWTLSGAYRPDGPAEVARMVLAQLERSDLS
jgi:hypothetical protein